MSESLYLVKFISNLCFPSYISFILRCQEFYFVFLLSQ